MMGALSMALRVFFNKGVYLLNLRARIALFPFVLAENHRV